MDLWFVTHSILTNTTITLYLDISADKEIE